MDHTAFNLQRTPWQPLPRKRSPDGASTECGGGYLIAAHYSFIDPERMKGRVGLVGWPIADAYPHKWSPISYRSTAGRRKNAGQRLTFYRWATQTNLVISHEHRQQYFIFVLFHMCEPLYFSTRQKPWNNSEMLKQFISEFHFSLISCCASRLKSFQRWSSQPVTNRTEPNYNQEQLTSQKLKKIIGWVLVTVKIRIQYAWYWPKIEVR